MKRLVVIVALLTVTLTGCSHAAPQTDRSAATSAATPEPAATVPALTGSTLDDATGIARSAGMDVKATDKKGHSEDSDSQPSLTVTSQIPAAGTPIGSTSTINVVVTNPILIKVPNMKGQDESDAEDALTSRKLDYHVTNDVDDDESDYVVKTQSPKAGSKVPVGTQVQFSVSPPRVVYKITSNGGTALITFSTGGTNQSQASGVHLPWHHSIAEDDSDFAFYYVSAQISGATRVSCYIYDGAQLISHHTSSGLYSIVTCDNS
jgi:beta-lactam-binding protein with PASTA domain